MNHHASTTMPNGSTSNTTPSCSLNKHNDVAKWYQIVLCLNNQKNKKTNGHDDDDNNNNNSTTTLDSLFKQCNNPIYMTILKKACESLESFELFWNHGSLPNETTTTFDQNDIYFVLLRLRSILFDCYVTDHVTTHPFSFSDAATTTAMTTTAMTTTMIDLSSYQNIQEYHTLEMDSELLSSSSHITRSTTEADTVENEQQQQQQQQDDGEEEEEEDTSGSDSSSSDSKSKSSSPSNTTTTTTKTTTTPTTRRSRRRTTITPSSTSSPNRAIKDVVDAQTRQRRPWKKTDDESKNQMYDEIYSLWKQLNEDESSEQFRKPVKKSQAPDYYEVIQNPIDLSSILKKIKSMAYETKNDFKNDLQLMFDNCREYNTDPETEVLQGCAQLESLAYSLFGHETEAAVAASSNASLAASSEADIFDRESRWHNATKNGRLPIVRSRSSQISKPFGEQTAIIPNEMYNTMVNEKDSENKEYSLSEYEQTVLPECDYTRGLVHPEVDPVRFLQQSLSLGFRDKESISTIIQKFNSMEKYDTSHSLQLAMQVALDSDRTLEHITRKQNERSQFEEKLAQIVAEQREKDKEDVLDENSDIESSTTEVEEIQDESSTTSDTSRVFTQLHVPTVAYDVSITDMGKNVHNIVDLREMRRSGSIIDQKQTIERAGHDTLSSIELDQTGVHDVLRSVVIMFLMNEGFELANTSTISLLTDVLDAYLLKFGTILNHYTCLNTNNSSLKDSLRTTIQETITAKPTDLRDIRKTVENQVLTKSERLQAARKRIESHILRKKRITDSETDGNKDTRKDTIQDDEEEEELDLVTSSIAFGSISDVVYGNNRRGTKRKVSEVNETSDPLPNEESEDNELIPIEEMKKSRKSKKKKVVN